MKIKELSVRNFTVFDEYRPCIFTLIVLAVVAAPIVLANGTFDPYKRAVEKY